MQIGDTDFTLTFIRDCKAASIFRKKSALVAYVFLSEHISFQLNLEDNQVACQA